MRATHNLSGVSVSCDEPNLVSGTGGVARGGAGAEGRAGGSGREARAPASAWRERRHEGADGDRVDGALGDGEPVGYIVGVRDRWDDEVDVMGSPGSGTFT